MLPQLRFFIDLTGEETAQMLGISEPTAQRWCVFARAWLTREVCGETELPPACDDSGHAVRNPQAAEQNSEAVSA